MTKSEMIDDLQGQVEALESSLGGAIGVAAQFDDEMRRVQETFTTTGQGAARLERTLSSGVTRAIDGVVLDGMKLSDALSTVAQSLSNSAYNAAVKPVTDHFGGLLTQGVTGLVQGILPFANGAPFSQGRVMPFADGGVVSQATHFGMRGGMGVMGEAGPEAIMPLARGPDGKLGVRAGGGGSTAPTVVMNISTPDVAGFQRSRGQIAAQMSRALSAGQKNR